MSKYVLSPEVQKSLKQIKNFSDKRFEVKRTKCYLNEILLAFRELAENSARVIIRQELMPDYYSYFVESHIIYYRIKPEVIDVLHQSMEPSRFLPD